jgi:hypothetical protein
MNIRVLTRKSLIVLVALLAIIGMQASQASAQTDNLSSALQFSLLTAAFDGETDIANGSKVSGWIGAPDSVVIGNNGRYNGSVLSVEGTIVLGNWTKVLGRCATILSNPIITGVGASCGSYDTEDEGGQDAIVPILDSGYFSCNVTEGIATQSIPAVNVAAGRHFTITDAISGGFNLIDIPSVTLSNSSTLTLSGGSSDTLVLRVDGNTIIGSGAKIVLTGGLSPSAVVIATQGGISSWKSSTTISGTIVNGLDFVTGGPTESCITGSGTTINGALICTGGIQLGANARVNLQPADLVHLPNICDKPYD